ncbi:hypothetical protein [uncultured Tateyamaria sp.]|uniref:hypothetical protein n=1 Tax=uncultured Tateyamaria sp. TaxID=455651 RepID=UPI002624F4B7|nr:hypothetical protein [uncultured Tateyamaria sp.]
MKYFNPALHAGSYATLTLYSLGFLDPIIPAVSFGVLSGCEVRKLYSIAMEKSANKPD